MDAPPQIPTLEPVQINRVGLQKVKIGEVEYTFDLTRMWRLFAQANRDHQDDGMAAIIDAYIKIVAETIPNGPILSHEEADYFADLVFALYDELKKKREGWQRSLSSTLGLTFFDSMNGDQSPSGSEPENSGSSI
jgi:hypothetical protein